MADTLDHVHQKRLLELVHTIVHTTVIMGPKNHFSSSTHNYTVFLIR